MSELINTNDNRATIRWKLLTGVSTLALAAYVSSAGIAGAEDVDHPQLWIELGGQVERLDNPQELLALPFVTQAPSAIQAPIVDAQKFPLYSFGDEGKLTFSPNDSNWVFSAGIRYGRSSAKRHEHYQTAKAIVPFTASGKVLHFTATRHAFGDGQADLRESHSILDFQAGRDIGLGIFGGHGSSVFSVGVRFAQFASRTGVTLAARPTYTTGPFITGTRSGKPTLNLHYGHYHRYTAVIQAEHNVHAVGPSLSWNASLPIAGNASDMAIDFDWGVNAALLFGRQRAKVHHKTSGSYHSGLLSFYTLTTFTHAPPDQNRSRSITIPNAGGFAGMSFKFPNAKVSIGYRGDFFFGAMDNGIDARKSTTLGFYGPFASISVGLGD